jgi:hypothetical protein
MISAKQSHWIWFARRFPDFGLRNRSPHHFRLRNTPACGQALESLGRHFVQGKSRAVSHRSHTITHTITFLTFKLCRSDSDKPRPFMERH